MTDELEQMSLNQRRAVDKALAALETFATIWAAEIRLGAMSARIAAVPNEAERAKRIEAMIEQGFIEGAYRHYLDHKDKCDELEAVRATAEQSLWQPIETAPMTGRTLLLGYPNSLGNWRTVRGEWLTQDYIDQNWEEPDEAEAGWYETSVEADDVPSCWPITPTHWQPLPKPPADAAIESQRSERESS